MVRVIDLRNEKNRAGKFIYVGREMPRYGLARHPLANPFKVATDATAEQRLQCLIQYGEWLLGLPGHDDLLRVLATQVAISKLPLACWCADWDGITDPAPTCHAVFLARIIEGMRQERSGKWV